MTSGQGPLSSLRGFSGFCFASSMRGSRSSKVQEVQGFRSVSSVKSVVKEERKMGRWCERMRRWPLKISDLSINFQVFSVNDVNLTIFFLCHIRNVVIFVPKTNKTTMDNRLFRNHFREEHTFFHKVKFLLLRTNISQWRDVFRIHLSRRIIHERFSLDRSSLSSNYLSLS